MRPLIPEERSLLAYLMRKGGLARPSEAWMDELRVENLDDEGIRGGFVVRRQADRDHAELIADVDFTDLDGVHVLASLFVDRNKIPCEVDIWKTDDTALLALPMFPN